MAKAAKQVDHEITEQRWNAARAKILGHFERIESARGSFMNIARREREGMTNAYEGLTAFGISQKASRLSIRIERDLQKIKGLIAALEAEERRRPARLAKLAGDKQQIGLCGDLPRQQRPPKRTRPTVVETEPEVEAANAA